MIRFYSEELLTPNSTPKVEDLPLSPVRDCLFDVFAATLHIGGRAVVTGTQISQTKCQLQR